LVINHKNGNKEDNRLENLELVTQKDNIQHAMNVLKTFNQKGENNNNSKLTENEVREIKELLKRKELLVREIARRYDVNAISVRRIKNRKSWRHII